MARARRHHPPGMVDGPDLGDEPLEPWRPAPLRAGFVIEEAALGADADLAGLDAPGGRIVRSRLDGVALAGAVLPSLALTDVEVCDSDLSGVRLAGARLRRVRFAGCRMTGLDAAELDAEEVQLER